MLIHAPNVHTTVLLTSYSFYERAPLVQRIINEHGQFNDDFQLFCPFIDIHVSLYFILMICHSLFCAHLFLECCKYKMMNETLNPHQTLQFQWYCSIKISGMGKSLCTFQKQSFKKSSFVTKSTQKYKLSALSSGRSIFASCDVSVTSPRSTVRIFRPVPLDSLTGDKVRVTGRKTYACVPRLNVPLCQLQENGKGDILMLKLMFYFFNNTEIPPEFEDDQVMLDRYYVKYTKNLLEKIHISLRSKWNPMYSQKIWFAVIFSWFRPWRHWPQSTPYSPYPGMLWTSGE